MSRKKVVILGGGISSLAAAFALTDQPGWQDRFEITLYQLGWRLGGKGASGRAMAPELSRRIEEHGIHVFFGFYENAFRLMQECYAELGRPPGAPLATWQEAFDPHSVEAVEELMGASWQTWVLQSPEAPGVPGRGPVSSWLGDLAPRVLHAAARKLLRATFAMPAGPGTKVARPALPWRKRPATLVLACALFAADGLARPVTWIGRLLSGSGWGRRLCELLLTPLAWLFRLILDGLWLALRDRVDDHSEVRKVWVILNFAYGNFHGALRDGVLSRGVASLNDEDYREWLGRHVKPDHGITADSALTRLLYDAAFSYEKGDPRKPSLEAGTALLAYARMFLTYKGAFYYKMRAGMGDTVFAPLYQVLRQRGVRFELFHRLEHLRLDATKTRVRSIHLQRQVLLEHGTYDPLLPVKGLPCWPAEPLWDQIRDGEAVRAELARLGTDLESYAPLWPGYGEVVLEEGAQFDEVILGVSLGGIPYVAADLVAASPRWQSMVRHVQTTATQAFQLWFKKPLEDLGWTLPAPILTSYDVALTSGSRNPNNSWADMSQTLPTEDWPPEPGRRPLSVQSFCCPLADTESEPIDPARQRDGVRRTAIQFMERFLGHLLPAVVDEQGFFRWELLVDNRPVPGQGRERFDAQFWVGVHNPSDRYVMSAVGSSRHRLQPDCCEFANVHPTGDWIDNTFNVGSAEGATMSGLAVANVLQGRPAGQGIAGWGIGAGPRSRAYRPADEQRRTGMGNPRYIESAGDQQVPPPYEITGLKSTWYVLPADPHKLKEVCDKYLNIAPHGPRYRNIFPCVFVQLNTYGKIVAESAPKQVMTAEEMALSLWLFRTPDLGMPFFQRYLFIDNPWSVVTGRSVFGFDKQYSEFNFEPSADGSFAQDGSGAGQTVRSLVFPTLESELTLEPILAVHVGPPPDVAQERHEPEPAFTDPSGFLQTLAEKLDAAFGKDSSYREILPSLGGHPKKIELDTLKQFRDAERPGEACYQAVVSTPMRKIRNFTARPLLGGPRSLELKSYQSLPIEELGIKSSSSVLTFEVSMDCELGPGRNLFVNTGSRSGSSGCLTVPLGLVARLFGGREQR